MKIAVVSKADAFGGGASKCAQELCRLINESGLEARHYCSWSGSGFNSYRIPLYGRYQMTGRRLHYICKKMGLPELIPVELAFFFRRHRLENIDLFHFHDLSSAVSPLTLLVLSLFKPVVWTIHDCSPFTGGCLYPMKCEAFRRACADCPQKGQWPIDNRVVFTHLMQKIKRKIHASENIFCTTPSKWMASMAASSAIVKKLPVVIRNGVNTKVFRPHDKQTIRIQLGLPAERCLILLSAGHLGDPRKGIRFAIEAVKSVRDLDPLVLLMGVPETRFEEELRDAGIDLHVFGYVDRPEQLCQCYAAADCLLFCSLADNQPLALLESMASGTPVVGFETGGIPEIVCNGKTGYLVPQGDQAALNSAIRRFFQNKMTECFSKEARAYIVRHHSYEQYIQRHIAFYRSVMEKFNSTEGQNKKWANYTRQKI